MLVESGHSFNLSQIYTTLAFAAKNAFVEEREEAFDNLCKS